jgi:hypothetical protein
MKTTLVILSIVLLLCAIAAPDVSAKPAYCYKALAACKVQCDELFRWVIPETRGCILGCSIGFLFC